MIGDKLFSVFKYCIIPGVSIFLTGYLWQIIIEAYRIEQELKQ
jgi:hypothetical protein